MFSVSGLQPVFTPEAVRRMEKLAIDRGLHESLLVESAGTLAAEFIRRKFQPCRVLVLSGSGHNGADACVVARHLQASGFQVFLFQALPVGSPVLLHMLNAALNSGVQKISTIDPLIYDLGIDGLFGTGLNRPPEEAEQVLIRQFNQIQSRVSLDLPSGLSAEGEVFETAIQAHLTLALGALKPVHLHPQARQYCSQIELLPIGLDLESEDPELWQWQPKALELPLRNPYGHKGSFGSVLVLGGSAGLIGAPCFAADAAFHTGSGKVHLLIPDYREVPCLYPHLIGHSGQDYSMYSAVLIGPGLGQSQNARKILEDLLSSFSGPIVIDADAFYLFSAKEWPNILGTRSNLVFTPHPKEMAHLAGTSTENILRNPDRFLRAFLGSSSHVVVLKDAGARIASAQKILVYHKPNSALAKGGTGDVLAGILLSLIGQGMPLIQASLQAVLWHSLAAAGSVLQSGPYALTPQSLIQHLGPVSLKHAGEAL